MTTGFTPGPWICGEPERHMYWLLDVGDYDVWSPTPGSDAAQANAHLIAASPDLYEALNNLIELAFDGPSEPKTWPDNGKDETPVAWRERIEREARAALAKARGE